MSKKINLIKPYFKQWRQDLSKANKLLGTNEYHCEAILILSCYIGALAALRFPRRADRDAYQRTVIRYGGMTSLYEKVDLLFFYQWPRSAYRRSRAPNARPYSRIKGYAQLKKSLVNHLGNEEAIYNAPELRYRSTGTITKYAPLRMARSDVRKTLRLFSLSEILYRFVRCHAVHHRSFPLVHKVYIGSGKTRYEDAHLLTGSKISETLKNIIDNLEKECLAKSKLPNELPNR